MHTPSEWTRPLLVDCPECPARRGERCMTKSYATNRGFHPGRKGLVEDMTAEQAEAGFAALDAERAAFRRGMRAHFATQAADPAVAAQRVAVNDAMDRVNRETLAEERRGWNVLNRHHR